jgi:hypothetical protein
MRPRGSANDPLRNKIARAEGAARHAHPNEEELMTFDPATVVPQSANGLNSRAKLDLGQTSRVRQGSPSSRRQRGANETPASLLGDA